MKKTIPLRLIENISPPYKAFQKILGQEVSQVEFIDVGVMNYVFRVTCVNGQSLYLKQALEDARKKDNIGPDLASVSHLRIKHEAAILRRLSSIFPSETPVVFPPIVTYDEENNILVSKDLRPAGFLQNDLEQGTVDLEIAGNLGIYLAQQHSLTFGKKNVLRENEENDYQNWLFFLNMRTRGVIPKSNLDEKVIQEINSLYEEAKTHHTYDVAINMDCCPKNILYLPDKKVGIIDLELASGKGDPAYDIGFLVGHYFIFAANSSPVNNDFLCAAQKIIGTYLDQTKSLPITAEAHFQDRLIKYAGSTMIYRIAGSSPAPFIHKESVPKILDIASALLTEKSPTLKDVFSKFDKGV